MKPVGAERGRKVHPSSRKATVLQSPRGAQTAKVTKLPRKPAKYILRRPVPQTDTGGRVEHTKALERLTVKELGKLTP